MKESYDYNKNMEEYSAYVSIQLNRNKWRTKNLESVEAKMSTKLQHMECKTQKLPQMQENSLFYGNVHTIFLNSESEYWPSHMLGICNT